MKTERKTGVYTITNLVNGKMIVGSGVLEDRKKDHFNKLKRNKHCNPHLQNSYNINGKENFVFEVIEEYEHEFCIDFEIYWINLLDTKNPEKGYNINDPKKGNLGRKHTDETKKKISILNKGKQPRLGSSLSDDTKKKISEANSRPRPWLKGISLSQETKDKIAKALTGNRHSEETKLKMSKSKLGHTNYPKNYVVSEETRKKISLIHTGKKMSAEAKLNMSKAQKGHLVSESTKEKIKKANSKIILQYDLEGNFIKKWESVKEASVALNINYSCIGSCAKGRKWYKTAGGFIWKFKE